MQKEDLTRLKKVFGAREKEDDGGEVPQWLTSDKYETGRGMGVNFFRRKKDGQDERRGGESTGRDRSESTGGTR